MSRQCLSRLSRFLDNVLDIYQEPTPANKAFSLLFVKTRKSNFTHRATQANGIKSLLHVCSPQFFQENIETTNRVRQDFTA